MCLYVASCCVCSTNTNPHNSHITCFLTYAERERHKEEMYKVNSEWKLKYDEALHQAQTQARQKEEELQLRLLKEQEHLEQERQRSVEMAKQMQVDKELAKQHLQQAEVELQRKLEASKSEHDQLRSQMEKEHAFILKEQQRQQASELDKALSEHKDVLYTKVAEHTSALADGKPCIYASTRTLMIPLHVVYISLFVNDSFI